MSSRKRPPSEATEPASRPKVDPAFDAPSDSQTRKVATGDEKATRDERAAKPTEDTLFRPKDVVAKRYRIVKFIAHGGMGEVYEAKDLELDDRVALKTVRADAAADERARERFKREILLARKVTHPNVCRIFDLGTHDGGVSFLTMELLQGETLGARIAKRGRLEPREALPLIKQMAAGLEAAHKAGIIHRDFKPANVILLPPNTGEKYDRAVITDFGVARSIGLDLSRSISRTGEFVGSPAYMAPEQLDSSIEPTEAVDVYAFGLVVYEMITGTRPFASESSISGIIKRFKTRATPPTSLVAALDPRWDQVIERCLAVEPSERYASPVDAVAALADTVEPTAPVPRSSPRRPLLIVAIALAAAALGVGGYAIFHNHDKPSAVAPTDPAPAAPSSARRSIAVLGFDNEGRQAPEEWIGTALGEIMTVDLAVGGKLRVEVGERVSRARREYALEPSHLDFERLGRALGSDYVVTGTFFALGPQSGGKLRFDIKLYDAKSHQVVSETSLEGTEAGLFDLASRAAARVRIALAVPEPSPAEAATAYASLPSQPEATRLYAEGLERLRAYEPNEAKQLFEQAVKAEPTQPLVHVALARALAQLGFDATAADEAKRGFDLAKGLSREDQLVVEGLYYETSKQWAQAVEVYQALYRVFGDNVDYGLRLAHAQAFSGNVTKALALLDDLRKLPPPMSLDPRIDLEEAVAQGTASDFKKQAEAAQRAAKKGTDRGAKLLVAEARNLESWALRNLGKQEASVQAFEEARQIYEAAGDRGGMATLLNTAAPGFVETNDPDRASAMFTKALELARAIGDRRNQARALNGLGTLAKTRLEAKGMFEEGYRITSEIGDKRGMTRTGLNVAIALGDLEQYDTASKKYEEVLVLARETHDADAEAGVFSYWAEMHLAHGALGEAEKVVDRALEISRKIDRKHDIAEDLHLIGRIELARGNPAKARTAFTEAAKLRKDLGEMDVKVLSDIGALEAEWDDTHKPETAAAAIAAAKEAHDANAGEVEALGHVLAAQILLETGKPAEAKAEAVLARGQLTRGDYRLARFPVTLIEARVAGQLEPEKGKAELDKLLGAAREIHHRGQELEIQLAQVAIDPQHRGLDALVKAARDSGYLAIVKRAKALTGRK